MSDDRYYKNSMRKEYKILTDKLIADFDLENEFDHTLRFFEFAIELTSDLIRLQNQSVGKVDVEDLEKYLKKCLENLAIANELLKTSSKAKMIYQNEFDFITSSIREKAEFYLKLD